MKRNRQNKNVTRLNNNKVKLTMTQFKQSQLKKTTVNEKTNIIEPKLNSLRPALGSERVDDTCRDLYDGYSAHMSMPGMRRFDKREHVVGANVALVNLHTIIIYQFCFSRFGDVGKKSRIAGST